MIHFTVNRHLCYFQVFVSTNIATIYIFVQVFGLNKHTYLLVLLGQFLDMCMVGFNS